MKQRFLVSTKKPGLEFKILGRTVVDEQAGEIDLVLLGAHGVKFTRRVNQSILDQYGYVVQVRDDSPSPPG